MGIMVFDIVNNWSCFEHLHWFFDKTTALLAFVSLRKATLIAKDSDNDEQELMFSITCTSVLSTGQRLLLMNRV